MTWTPQSDPARKAEYRAMLYRFHCSLRWMRKKEFYCLRFDRGFKVPWFFLAVKQSRICIVLSRRRVWANDEDVKKLKQFRSSHLDILIMRWDTHAKIPRLGKMNDRGDMEEVYDDEIIN